MVVEDHDFQRRMTLRLLRDLGAGTLLEAASGHEALRLLAGRSGPVDLIFCDLDMPEMDGVEFIGHVAEGRLSRAVAVVSSMEAAILNTVETMAKAYGLQVLCAISKPLDPQQLAQCISSFQTTESVAEASRAAAEFSAADLRQGLEAREFLVFFQPQVSIATGKVHGVEALARWFRPGHGVVLPPAFIPRMKIAGLERRLTEDLLEQTCGHLNAWAAKGWSVTASVNVSMVCLEDTGFADRLHDLVRDSGCDPRQVTFEVTETDVMTDVAKALNVLARLRLKGFGLSIDDFGTGYSSLQQLSNAPFTELKIDQSFVKDSPTQPRHRTIVEASLGLARKLGLQSVAEGVETQEEWDLLKSLGCAQAQGFFVARPMPGHQVPEWAETWRAQTAGGTGGRVGREA